MSSAARAYRNPDELKSANFAPPQLSPLERRIESSQLPGRKAHTLRCFVRVSKQGPDFFASTFAVSYEARVSYRTVQRHLDWLERERVIEKKHPANHFYVPGHGIRRTATYVLHKDAQQWLSPAETYNQWRDRNRRQAPPQRKRAQNTSHSSSLPGPAPVPSPAPQQSAAAPSTPQQLRRLTPRELRKLAESIAFYMKGRTHMGDPRDGMGVQLSQNDSRYIKPLSRREAVEAACKSLLIPLESAVEALKLAGYSLVSEPEDSP